MHELIIIGGGAIGLFLAKEFAQKGKSVLLLEKKDKIGSKVCSGLVSRNIFKYIPEKDIVSFCEGKINGAKLWIGEKQFFFKGKALLLNRNKFDNYLFEEAKKSGVEIVLGQRIINILEKDNFVKIFSEDGKIFKGKILAGCDGAVSLTAKKVGLPTQKKLLLGVVTYLKRNEEKNEKFVELFFSKKIPGFFIWKIPREKKDEWGIALRQDQNPRKILEDFLREKNLKILSPKAALIPYFPLKKTITKRVFLCGDSAGQIKPYTGGGIIYGFECAKIAADTIRDFATPNLGKYEREWEKSLMKKIYFGNFIRRCYYSPNLIKKIALFLLNKRKNIDQDNPFSIFNYNI